MLLCLDVGNSQVFGGIFRDDQFEVQFRRTSQTKSTSDEFGVFFRSVLRENNVDPDLISQVAICCVVPDNQSQVTDHWIRFKHRDSQAVKLKPQHRVQD